MRCHVDARCLSGERTGIGVFTASVLAHWPEGVPVRHVRTGEDGVQHDRRLWHLRVAWSVLRTGEPYLSTDSLVVPALLGRRATVVVHDLATLDQPATHHWRARAFYRALLGVVCRRAGAVVVPTEATREALVRRHPGVAGRVHVALEAPRELPGDGRLPPGVAEPYVLHTGTHEPRKNVLALVEAFLAADLPADWSLVLAGKAGWLGEDEARRLDELVAGHAQVVRLGFVGDAELGALYDAASVFCYPSSYEGFGLPVVEAMRAGVPVVVTDAAALTEVAGGAAEVVPLGPGLAQRLTTTLAALAADPARRDALAQRGRARAQDFSWQRTADAVHAAVAATGA